MANLNDLDEFVNWDNTDNLAWDDADHLQQSQPQLPSDINIDPSLTGMATDLVFANINEDDFSFHALEHFTEQNAMTFMDTDPTALSLEAAMLPREQQTSQMMPPTTVHTDFWETPKVPCANCALGGFSCKKIREGRFKGYCTSCVAQTVECSFGGVILDSLNPTSTTLAPSAWPMVAEDSPFGVLPSESHSNQHSNRSSMVDLTNLASTDGDDQASFAAARQSDTAPPKIGARFSRESVRILKTWLTTHNRHPYPSDEEKEMLQRKTGLNKTQITNWLANARRRGKVQPPRSTSPLVGNLSQGVGSIDIPKRRGTPALETMNPLQRWEHSPPEHEPASVTAIARAVTASSSSFGVSSGLNSPFSLHYTDDGSSRSLCNQSSASSLGTSHSGSGSKGSAYSYGSRNSFGSFGSAPFSSRSRRRRRRATQKQGGDTKTELHAPLRTFQCTFCTETFRTKHDWQRHEKSLHLSLERWVCAPHGSRAVHPTSGQLCCIFCGDANPDDAHIEAHNHSTCQGRSLGEKTFYRKDHLNQHLRLVHNVKYMDWSMKSWKIATPEIKSRCGFCGIVMDTWTIRVDHLAEHFKTGHSMADWKGDWGFDVPVLDMVENSIPPYLIHHERTSPLPYVATHSSPESPRNAYELIKLEMAYFIANHIEQHGDAPTDEEMMVEGCRIIFASELLSLQGIAAEVSWLRDLVMMKEDNVHRARFAPLRAGTENRLATLKINGKDNLFEQCPMECQLQEFVKAKRLLGLTAMDDELQTEACRIVGRVEEVSTHPSDAVANWLLRLIMSRTHWLSAFRRRAHLPRTEDVKDEIIRSTDPTNIDSTIHSYTRLERELADFLKLQRAMGFEPTDEDLQRQARIIIYEFDDGWNQTAADNVHWLAAFRERHPLDGHSPPAQSSPAFSLQKSMNLSMTTADTPLTKTSSAPTALSPVCSTHRAPGQALDANGNVLKASPLFLNDANCYRRLARELRRWVAATTSPLNPSCHVPTDAELQHQARFILYDDDDPWNQTAADNAEWLQRFKRHCGIVKDGGPGLSDGPEWAVEQGGSGFAPPYAFPKSQHEPFHKDVQITLQSGAKPFPAGQSVANSFLQDFKSRYPRPATIFCSRELEMGLVSFVQDRVAETSRMPSIEAIRAEGKRIHKYQPSPMDDLTLVVKFHEWMSRKFPQADHPMHESAAAVVDEAGASLMPMNLDLKISDEELGNILQDMEFDFDGQGFEHDGGVSLTGFRD